MRQQLYAIRVGEHTLKIGLSNDPRKRLRTIATGCPAPPALAAAAFYDQPPEAERCWHHRLVRYRSHGEWFVMPARLADAVCRLIGTSYLPIKALQRFASVGLPVAKLPVDSGELFRELMRREYRRRQAQNLRIFQPVIAAHAVGSKF